MLFTYTIIIYFVFWNSSVRTLRIEIDGRCFITIGACSTGAWSEPRMTVYVFYVTTSYSAGTIFLGLERTLMNLSSNHHSRETIHIRRLSLLDTSVLRTRTALELSNRLGSTFEISTRLLRSRLLH